MGDEDESMRVYVNEESARKRTPEGPAQGKNENQEEDDDATPKAVKAKIDDDEITRAFRGCSDHLFPKNIRHMPSPLRDTDLPDCSAEPNEGPKAVRPLIMTPYFPVPDNAFKDMTKTELYLRNHMLTKIPKELYKLTNLTLLNISNNSLRTVPSKLFTKLSHLQSLVVNDNLLTTFPFCKAFRSGTLRVLEFGRNYIDFGSLPEKETAALNVAVTVHVSGIIGLPEQYAPTKIDALTSCGSDVSMSKLWNYDRDTATQKLFLAAFLDETFSTSTLVSNLRKLVIDNDSPKFTESCWLHKALMFMHACRRRNQPVHVFSRDYGMTAALVVAAYLAALNKKTYAEAAEIVYKKILFANPVNRFLNLITTFETCIATPTFPILGETDEEIKAVAQREEAARKADYDQLVDQLTEISLDKDTEDI